MSRLFAAALAELNKGYIHFGSGVVSVLLSCGKRGNRSFDAQGCAETIADWLEPSEKKGGNSANICSRGWGVGLIANDNQVRIYPHFASDFGQDTETTTIIIRKFESIRVQTINFITEFFLPSLRPVA